MFSWSFKKGGRQRSKQLKVDKDKALVFKGLTNQRVLQCNQNYNGPADKVAMRRQEKLLTKEDSKALYKNIFPLNSTSNKRY